MHHFNIVYIHSTSLPSTRHKIKHIISSSYGCLPVTIHYTYVLRFFISNDKIAMSQYAMGHLMHTNLGAVYRRKCIVWLIISTTRLLKELELWPTLNSFTTFALLFNRMVNQKALLYQNKKNFTSDNSQDEISNTGSGHSFAYHIKQLKRKCTTLHVSTG